MWIALMSGARWNEQDLKTLEDGLTKTNMNHARIVNVQIDWAFVIPKRGRKSLGSRGVGATHIRKAIFRRVGLAKSLTMTPVSRSRIASSFPTL